MQGSRSPSSWAAQGSPLPSKGCEKQDSATSSGCRTVCRMHARGSVSCTYPRLKALRSILSTILVTFLPCTVSSRVAGVTQLGSKEKAHARALRSMTSQVHG